MRLTRLTLLLVCAIATVHGQAPPRDQAPVPVPTGTAALEGTVVDQKHEPIRHALVTIKGDMRLTLAAVTEDDGRFSFSALPAGRFTITAEKAAYPAISYGAKRANRPGAGVLLANGQTVSGLVLAMPRGGVLTGTVYDEHGQPLPDVPVMAWEVRPSLTGERTLDFPATGGVSVKTDDRGMYRVFDLPPGEYTVGTAWFYSGLPSAARVPTDDEIRAAFAASQQAARTTGAVSGSGAPAAPRTTPPVYNYASVFSPGVVDPLIANTVQLAAGEERTGIDLRMQLVPMPAIKGIVVSPEGAPVEATMGMARHALISAQNTSMMWSTTPEGTFATPSLAPGDYTVRANTRGDATHPPLWAKADVTVTGTDPVQVTLRLEPAVALTGRLVFEGATPPAAADIARVRLSMSETAYRNPGGSSPGTVDANGTFSIPNLVPSSYRLNVNLPGSAPGTPPAWTLRSVVVDGRDATDLPFDVPPGGVSSVVVTFSDQVAELAGSLVDQAGQPATDYFVIVMPTDARYLTPQSRRIASARPDVTGHFTFRGLPAGDYTLAATTDLVQSDLQNASILSQLAAEGMHLTIGIGEKKTVTLQVAR
jgi:protocatechuate 3,4-dioxygenase beta subunit